MRNHRDQPIYRTFEEFEREELRRADAVASTINGLFDDLLDDELDLSGGGPRGALSDYGDDEE